LGGGFLAQPGRRTVCGTLTGAGLSRLWSRHRAHRFFSHVRWSSEDVTAVLTRLVVDRLVPAGDAVVVAVDDTLFKRNLVSYLRRVCNK
ncbi:MAG TPA: transposase, partial [Candidatus Lustribacter sp.]|nr:transposase [Candidatus Lustribacter sp.]